MEADDDAAEEGAEGVEGGEGRPVVAMLPSGTDTRRVGRVVAGIRGAGGREVIGAGEEEGEGAGRGGRRCV